jgi:hypothetical protein
MKIVRCKFIFKVIKTVKEFENGISFVILQNVTLLSIHVIVYSRSYRSLVRSLISRSTGLANA